MDWSLVCEYLGFILLFIVALMFHQRGAVLTRKRKLFAACLATSMLAIVLNVLTFVSLKHFYLFPLWAHYLFNSGYFFMSVLMAALIVYYLECRINDFFYDKRGLRVVTYILLGSLSAFAVLIFANIFTGWLFSFDGSIYVRGPLNVAGYVLVGFYVVVLVISFYRYRSSVSSVIKRIMVMAPTLFVMLVPFQVMFPDQLMNGMISAIVCLIIFLNFQSVPVETDSLTGLGNRLKCIGELSLRTRGKQRYQVIVVALRGFAQINHAYGHRSGDSVLFHIAKELAEQFPEARVFRFNSVEFLLLMPACASFVHDLRVDRVCMVMDHPWPAGNGQTKVPYCVVDLCDLGGAYTTEDVVERLDYSVTLAKAEDRKVLRYNREVDERFDREQALEFYMQNAHRENAYEVWYQPIFYHATGRFDSCEALVRMRDADGSFVSPGEFIPIAENNGMIDQITEFVLEESCKLLASDDPLAPLSVSVNLTIRQLLRDDLISQFKGLLNRYQFEPSRLKLEITERIISENEEAVLFAMLELNDLGFRFLLDDFGTGYSNFASMLSLPFECVKIDRSLVKDLPDPHAVSLLGDTLVPLFRKMGRSVLVEGIETQEQLDAALSVGVDRVQGFYFARPMPIDQLLKWYEGANVSYDEDGHDSVIVETGAEAY